MRYFLQEKKNHFSRMISVPSILCNKKKKKKKKKKNQDKTIF